MLIILEGVDRTGKSTLARALQAQTGAAVLHKSAPRQEDPLTEYLAPLAGYAPRTNLNLICDRWHWGETVWPGIYGRPALFRDASTFDYVDEAIASMGAIAVHCTGDSISVWNDVVRTSDEPLVTLGVQTLLDAQAGFDVVSGVSVIPQIRYDYRAWPDRSLSDWVSTIVELAALTEG